MGSLVPEWDSTRLPGKPPKGFEDFHEPSATGNPRLRLARTHSKSHDKGPPVPESPRSPDAAPMVHGAHAMCRYLSRASTGTPRAGGSTPSSPFSKSPPCSPRAGQTRSSARAAAAAKFYEYGRMPEEEEERRRCSAWCERVDSASLNVRPDEGKRSNWAHGSFKMASASYKTLALSEQPDQEEAAAAAAMEGSAKVAGADPATPLVAGAAASSPAAARAQTGSEERLARAASA